MSTTEKIAQGLTKQQKKSLLKAIAIAGEKAYRRGFPHGFLAGQDPKGTYGVITEADVSAWRYARDAEANRRSFRKKLHPWAHNPITPLGRVLAESRSWGDVIPDFMRDSPSIDEEKV